MLTNEKFSFFKLLYMTAVITRLINMNIVNDQLQQLNVLEYIEIEYYIVRARNKIKLESKTCDLIEIINKLVKTP